MAVDQEKLVKKAKSMREEYRINMERPVRPYVEIGNYREISVSLIPNAENTPLLIWVPKEPCATPMPVYISLHSGAWTRGSAHFDDYICRLTCSRVGCMVIGVEFKLAPEYKFPIQPEECYAAVKWVYDHAEDLGIDRNRISIGGHNTGGNLAAVVSHLARDRKEFKLRDVVLDCPVINFTIDSLDLPDFEDDDPMRGPIRGAFFNTCYLGDVSLATHPMVSPALEPNLEGLPPTLVLAAGLDPQCPLTLEYAERLKAAGTDVTYHCFEGQKHGFNVQPGIAPQEEADKVFEYIDSFLKTNM